MEGWAVAQPDPSNERNRFDERTLYGDRHSKQGLASTPKTAQLRSLLPFDRADS